MLAGGVHMLHRPFASQACIARSPAPIDPNAHRSFRTGNSWKRRRRSAPWRLLGRGCGPYRADGVRVGRSKSAPGRHGLYRSRHCRASSRLRRVQGNCRFAQAGVVHHQGPSIGLRFRLQGRRCPAFRKRKCGRADRCRRCLPCSVAHSDATAGALDEPCYLGGTRAWRSLASNGNFAELTGTWRVIRAASTARRRQVHYDMQSILEMMTKLRGGHLVSL